MMRYQIITADSLDRLEHLVQQMLELGWEPAGGVAVTAVGALLEYHQAVMMRKE